MCIWKGQPQLSRSVLKDTILGLLRAAGFLPLLLAIFLFGTIIAAAIDIHDNQKSTATCVICKFVKNLSCGSDAAASTAMPASEHPQTAPVNVDSSILSKTTSAPPGSRSPLSSSSSSKIKGIGFNIFDGRSRFESKHGALIICKTNPYEGDAK